MMNQESTANSTRTSALYRIGPWCVLLLPLLACNVFLPGAVEPTPTFTPVVIRFDIDSQAAPVDDVERAPTVIKIVPATAPPSATPTPSATPSPAPTLTPTAPPVATPLPPAAEQSEAPSPPPEPAVAAGGGPIGSNIVLRGPEAGFTLPPGMDQLEFKWKWQGEVLRSCQLKEKHSFEVRIWPDPATVPGPVAPMGTIDAVEARDIIAASCDPKSGTWRYTVNYLKNTPAVRQAGGYGHFFWDVAYIQLEPYYVPLEAAPPLHFYIPPDPDTPPTPTPSPIPVFVPGPGARPEGTISLLQPERDKVFNAAVGPVEFKWRWSGSILEDKCQPPEGYGFEIRLGSTRPGLGLLGVMDTVLDQHRIGCDRATGDFYYTVLNLKQAPGIKAAFAGPEFRWDGQFAWDVALVSLNPYAAPVFTATPRPFEISLTPYQGSFDPSGAPLKCGNFPSWIDAQALFLAAGGPDVDTHKLDPDGNQVACDELRR